MAETSTFLNPSTNLSPEEEKIIIRNLVTVSEADTKEGDSFYLIGHTWWMNWLEYANQSSLTRPSCIDNMNLVVITSLDDSMSEIELQSSLVEGRDYELIPQDVWNQLLLWYGGGPAVERKVINSGRSKAELYVEVYPLHLHLLYMPSGEHSTIKISIKETIGELHRRACEIFALNPDQVLIWDEYGHTKYALMYDMSKTLDNANIQADQEIMLEIDTLLSENIIRRGISLAGNVESIYGISATVTRSTSAGLRGLKNLGNTCYMNSAIQCLVHTPEFCRYFFDDYQLESNRKNALGIGGELSKAFGELLRTLWSRGRGTVAPTAFKEILGKFNPLFSGYNQHDSQELLGCLLNGLHGVLNRVKDKSYVHSRDADGRPDEEIADEYWANHIARNDSIIANVCQGHLKSTLVCSGCKKESVTFEPFMFLCLPLGFSNDRTMTVTVVSCDGTSLPNACTVTVPKQGNCGDLISTLIHSCPIKESETLLLAEVRDNSIHQLFKDPLMSLSVIKDDDHLTAYKIPKLENKTIYLELVHRRQFEERGGKTPDKVNWRPYGIPLVWPVACEDVITRGHLQSIVHRMLSTMVRAEEPNKNAGCCTNITTEMSRTLHFIDSNETCGDNISLSQNKESSSPVKSLPLRLHLQMVDENNACIDISEGEDEIIPLSTSVDSISIFVDWSDEQLESYDSQYLENLPEVLKLGPAAKKARSEPLSLYTCLENFLRETPLPTRHCPQCKEEHHASMKADLWRLPNVLVIHLSRFSNNMLTTQKLETFVNFPIHDFDLTEYVACENGPRKQLYELYALINHFGGMDSGHYTAYIKRLDENRWYNFDDIDVTPISEEDVKTAAAYVLLYRRVKTDNISSSNVVLSEDPKTPPQP